MDFHLNCITYVCLCHCSQTHSHQRINWREDNLSICEQCCVLSFWLPFHYFILVNRTCFCCLDFIRIHICFPLCFSSQSIPIMPVDEFFFFMFCFSVNAVRPIDKLPQNKNIEQCRKKALLFQRKKNTIPLIPNETAREC